MSNSAGTGYDVQDSGSDSATLQEQELGSEGGDNEGDGGITPSVGPEDIWDIILASQGGGIGVFIGGGGLGDDGAVENEGVHLEAEG